MPKEKKDKYEGINGKTIDICEMDQRPKNKKNKK
jgi:hypothetical protein